MRRASERLAAKRQAMDDLALRQRDAIGLERARLFVTTAKLYYDGTWINNVDAYLERAIANMTETCSIPDMLRHRMLHIRSIGGQHDVFVRERHLVVTDKIEEALKKKYPTYFYKPVPKPLPETEEEDDVD